VCNLPLRFYQAIEKNPSASLRLYFVIAPDGTALLTISSALHPDVFDQPGRKPLFQQPARGLTYFLF